MASAANASIHYFDENEIKIDENAEILVWSKHSHVPYIIIKKFIRKNEEVVVNAYGNSFNYKY